MNRFYFIQEVLGMSVTSAISLHLVIRTTFCYMDNDCDDCCNEFWTIFIWLL